MNIKDVSFWAKVNNTIQLFGTGGQVALVAAHASPVWNYVTAGATIAGMVLAIWMDDRNGNGMVDVFEKEIKVTSQSPITVETETPKP